MNRVTMMALLGVVLLIGAARTAAAAEIGAVSPSANVDPLPKAQALIGRGLAYLRTQQKEDGSWERPGDPPAISALVLKAFVSDGRYDTNQAFVEKGFNQLLTYQKPDGGIFRDLMANYNTAIAISALAASKDAKHQPAMQKAVEYLRRLQWSDKIDKVPERQQVAVDDPRYGGWGYGRKERPDGSNLQMALDALHDAGVKAGDPAYTAAITFLSRTQNRSESNNQPWAGNDGGFIYSTTEGGVSFAGEYTGPEGKKMLRSYGSMTYAGLKSMIYAGLTRDDPRVKSAWEWITKNWTWDENPGIKAGPGNGPESGLFYYYHTAARALGAFGEPVVTDAQGQKHDWRRELIDKLASTQKPDGNWMGENKWMENNPVLATAFAVLALEEAATDLKEHPVK